MLPNLVNSAYGAIILAIFYAIGEWLRKTLRERLTFNKFAIIIGIYMILMPIMLYLDKWLVIPYIGLLFFKIMEFVKDAVLQSAETARKKISSVVEQRKVKSSTLRRYLQSKHFPRYDKELVMKFVKSIPVIQEKIEKEVVVVGKEVG
jgi:hypothetical protein